MLNVFGTILTRPKNPRRRSALAVVVYVVAVIFSLAGGITAANTFVTRESPKEFLTRLTKSTKEEPKVEETSVLGVEETEEEPACVVEEVSRKCVGCYRAEVTKQKEDCATYTEVVDDQSCALACPQPTPAPVEPQQQAPPPKESQQVVKQPKTDPAIAIENCRVEAEEKRKEEERKFNEAYAQSDPGIVALAAAQSNGETQAAALKYGYMSEEDIVDPANVFSELINEGVPIETARSVADGAFSTYSTYLRSLHGWGVNEFDKWTSAVETELDTYENKVYQNCLNSL